MSNLRIVYDNAADRATVTASSTAGALAAANLLTDTKSDVWRATALAASILAAWPAAETIQAVALIGNFSPTTTMRVRVTSEPTVMNLFTCSEQFDAADWLKSRLAITSTSAIAPDGSANATVMAGDGSGASYLYQSRALNAGASYPVSCFVKAGTFAGGFLIRDFTESGDVTFNLTSLTVATTGTFSNGKAAAVGNGWYRVSATITPTTAGLHNVGLWVATTTGTVQVWGAMLASGSGSLTSYYPSFSVFSARTSTATYLASDGTVKVAAAGAARTQYTASNLQAPPKPLFEAAATNLVTASGTLTTGWSGNSSVTAVPAITYRGIATYQSVKKTLNTTSENKTLSLGAVAQNSTYTMSLALRADTSSTVSLGLFDSGNSSWGTAAESTLAFLEGSATVTQSNGVFTLSGLSATSDTVVQITRTFSLTGAVARVSIYPGGTSSTTIGDAVLVTRVQGEAGPYATSYIPTTTATVTRAADTYTTSAGVRPLGYIDTWQSYTYDSGAVLACPAQALRPRGWTAAQAASAYAYGGGAYARLWLPAAVQAVGLAVDIIDANNLQGYIEAARLIVGPYWSPAYNASDAKMTTVDTTELYRTDAGDQGADAGYVYRRVPVDLSLMPTADRAAFVNIARNSRAYPILVSVFPEVADLVLERDHMVYGRRSKDSDVAIEYATFYSTTIEVEEI